MATAACSAGFVACGVVEPALVRWSVRVPAAAAEVVAALLLDAFPEGLEEESDDGATTLSGYLPAGRTPALPPGLIATPVPVSPGWREGWRAFHRPVVLGPFWIGPPWLDPAPGLRPVVIEPGRAFGTGAHGSTRAAAALLLRIPAGGPMLDIGCGSGVLAIIAAMLGFRPVSAIDVDPLAIEATGANARANGVVIAARVGDAHVMELAPAPVAVANLQLELLGPLFARSDLPPSVIVSGLLATEPFLPHGWAVRDEETCDGWRAARFEHTA